MKMHRRAWHFSSKAITAEACSEKADKQNKAQVNHLPATNIASKDLIEFVRHFAYFPYLRTLSQRSHTTLSPGVLSITSKQSLFLSETDTLHAEGGNEPRMGAYHACSALRLSRSARISRCHAWRDLWGIALFFFRYFSPTTSCLLHSRVAATDKRAYTPFVSEQ